MALGSTAVRIAYVRCVEEWWGCAIAALRVCKHAIAANHHNTLLIELTP
jgi:hypothetical protein